MEIGILRERKRTWEQVSFYVIYIIYMYYIYSPTKRLIIMEKTIFY